MIFFEKLKEKKVYVILIIIAILIIGIVASLCLSKKEYVSVSKLLLIRTELNENNETENKGNIEITSKLVHTFKELLKSDSSVQKIEEELNIQNTKLKNNIKVKKNFNSDTFEIEVKYTDETTSVKISEALLDVFSDKLEEMYEDREIYVVDNPYIAKTTRNISIILSALISIIIGVLVSIIYIIASAIIERNVRINKNIDSEINLKKLIEIPLNNYKKNKSNYKNELVYYDSLKSPSLKAFKNLRTNIQFINVNNKDKNIMLVTSPLDGEGKSYITANLGVTFAEVGKKVIIIDSDMKNGRQNKIFNIPNNLGFSNYLSNLDSNGMEINKLTNTFINETEIKNLNLITSGTIPPNTTELLTSERLEQLVKDLSVFYDLVLIDGTSVLNNMDSLILSRVANSTILISDYRKTKKEDLFKAKKDIQNVGGRPMGLIINKAKIKKKISFAEIKADVIQKLVSLKEWFSKEIEIVKKKIDKSIDKVKEKKENKKQKLLMAAKIDKIEQKKNEEKEELKSEEITEDLSKKENSNDLKKEELKEESKKNNNESENIITFEDTPRTIIPEIERVEKSSTLNRNIKNKINNIILIDSRKRENSSAINNDKPNFDFKKYLNIAVNLKDKAILATRDFFVGMKNTFSSFVSNIKEKIEDRKKEKEFDKIYLKELQKDYESDQLSFDNLENFENSDNENLQESEYLEGQETFDDIKTQEEIIPESKEKEEIKLNSISNEKEIPEKMAQNNNIVSNTNNKEDLKNTEITNNIDIKNTATTSEDNLKEAKTEDDIETKQVKKNNSVLIIVDAGDGYCRVFSEKIFVEKLIRGIDHIDGFKKKHYSLKLINDRMQGLMSLYGINKKQAQRIDTLVYTTLCDYDDSVWLSEKIVSNKADSYAYCMAKNYDRLPDENKNDYEIRCKRLRKQELAEANIELEYKLDDIWSTNKINLSDKAAMLHFSNKYEVNLKYKTEDELRKKHENEQFYEEIIEKFDSKNEKEEENAENINSGIYELEKDEETILEMDKKIKKEEQKKLREEKSKLRKEKAEERKIERMKQKAEKMKKQEELRKQREEEKEKQKEEARIEEELLGDNLYPKTKYNRNL